MSTTPPAHPRPARGETEKPLLTERRVLDLTPEQARATLPRAIAEAFGGEVVEIEDGVWRTAMVHRGMAHDATLRLEERAGRLELVLEVAAHRTAPATALLGSVAFAMTLAWMGAAALTFVDFRGSWTAERVIAWVASLAVAFALTAWTSRLARTLRVNATAALARVEELWRGVDSLEAARIGRGYRVAPDPLTRDARLRVAPNASVADASVVSELEQEEDAEQEQPSAPRTHR